MEGWMVGGGGATFGGTGVNPTVLHQKINRHLHQLFSAKLKKKKYITHSRTPTHNNDINIYY